jgi:hypothetical protein
MMETKSNEFTPEELELLADAAATYISDWEGVEDDDRVTRMRALSIKIERVRLIGRGVRFQHKGNELRGVLKAYMDWEGLPMVKVRTAASYYVVGESDILGPVNGG